MFGDRRQINGFSTFWQSQSMTSWVALSFTDSLTCSWRIYNFLIPHVCTFIDIRQLKIHAQLRPLEIRNLNYSWVKKVCYACGSPSMNVVMSIMALQICIIDCQNLSTSCAYCMYTTVHEFRKKMRYKNFENLHCFFFFLSIKGFVPVYLYVHNKDIKGINIFFILAVGANAVAGFFPICLQ